MPRAWTPAETAHLASCGECTLEWRLIQAARHHGDARVVRVDAATVASRVVTRLRAEQGQARWRRRLWVTGLAAAAVVVLVVRTAFPTGDRGAIIDSTALAVAAPASTAFPMAELDALSADQLEAVLDHLNGAAANAPTGEIPLLGDLDDQQLERVLRSLEG